MNYLGLYESTCDFAFPEKEPGVVVCLSREEAPFLKHFYIYDVYKSLRVRKILKDDCEKKPVEGEEDEVFSDDAEAAYESDAFDVDPTGQVLIYCHGRYLNF